MSTFSKNFPHLSNLIQSFDEIWPDHNSFLEKGILNADSHVQQHAEHMAELFDPIISKDRLGLVKDYQWVCKMLLEEQLYFFRHGKYRLNTIEEAVEKIYSKNEIMGPYMNGLLISQFVWTNHTQANEFFYSKFLPRVNDMQNLMEVGPGHGMFLSLVAINHPQIELHAWDISYTSLSATIETLKQLGIENPIQTQACDLVAPNLQNDLFQAIVCSEVLEHTDKPQVAIQNLTDALKPGGFMFLNVPVNSPAPDHLTLWRTPDEVKNYYKSTGLKLEEFQCFPATGLTLDRAMKQKADITCVGILRKPV